MERMPHSLHGKGFKLQVFRGCGWYPVLSWNYCTRGISDLFFWV